MEAWECFPQVLALYQAGRLSNAAKGGEVIFVRDLFQWPFPFVDLMHHRSPRLVPTSMIDSGREKLQ